MKKQFISCAAGTAYLSTTPIKFPLQKVNSIASYNLNIKTKQTRLYPGNLIMKSVKTILRTKL
jgi:hypothetical protein